MKWSQLKKRIESTFADSVRGRVEVWNTRYRKSEWKEGEAWITIDKKLVQSMGSYTYWMESNREADRLRQERGCADPNDPGQSKGYWDAYYESLQTTIEKGIALPLWDVNEGLFDYLNMSIDDILKSNHPVIRAFGMLDKRLGKRRLKAIDAQEEHPLVRILYEFRCMAEGINQKSQPA